jgi:ATP-dependent DNA helicase DinG
MVDVDCIHDVFPHRDSAGRPSYRRHQFEVIRDALSAFDSGIETVVVEAPTGSGKTDIAKTVAMYMTRGFQAAKTASRGMPDPSEVLSKHQAHMVTSMKMLQDAYLKTSGHVTLVKGKSNYECKKDPRGTMSIMAMSLGSEPAQNFTCQDADSFYGSAGCGSRSCGYKKAREDAHVSALALFNFDSFLSQVSLGKAFPHQRSLITVDEAHNVEDKIISFAAVDLTEDTFRSLGLQWTPLRTEKDVVAWAGVVNGVLSKAAADFKEQLSALREAKLSVNRQVDGRRLRLLSWQLKTCEESCGRLQRYLISASKTKPSSKPMPWVAEFDEKRVRLEPVNGGRFVRDALLKWGEKQLLLSATFLDGSGAYSRALRLKSGSTAKFSVPSTFPADRRPVIKRYVGDLGYKGYDGNFDDLSKTISDIVSENPSQRGVVHCTSYAMADGLKEALGGNGRFVWHGRENRDSVVRSFMDPKISPADGVLVGVGLTEGYDFAGDLCRFQALIRIPYPYPSKRLKARSEKDPQHMDWRTCLTLVQTYGRGMRSSDDHCRTYVLDDRFDRFLNINKGQLPGWFLEAVK